MASKKGERPLWKANREVTFEPADLPEFGLKVSWAMCRNPMCENFGVFFTGHIRKGGTASSDDNYRVSIKVVTATHTDDNGNKETSRWLAGQIECRRCGQCSRLPSNRAIRPIARYYLSLSLPFADCANPECPNHGINVFEHWKERPKRQSQQSQQSQQPRQPRQPRHYRKNGGNHQVCCVHCGSRAVRQGRRERRSDLIEEAKENGGKKRPIKHERYSPYINLGEAMRPHGVNGATKWTWEKIIEGVRTGRSVTDTYEIMENLSISTYYRHLDRIAARLRDYHSARNVRLLHPSYAKWNEPIQLYTDVLDISLQAWEKGHRHVLLKYIVTTVPAGDTLFILAAHPFFLPKRLCPEDTDRDRDHPKLRVNFEREWDGLHHEGIASEPGLKTAYVKKNFPEIGRGGYFIRSPYAEVAHFLTVQKMLTRFRTMHCYMDAAKELYTAALVAMRGRIMAGKPGAGRPADGRRRNLPTTEIVLFQHKKKDRVRKAKVYTGAFKDLSFEKRQKKRKKSLEKAWKKAEKRIRKESIKALNKDLTKDKKNLTMDLLPKKKFEWSTLSRNEKASARRTAHRKAFTGGYSKYGGWVWLKFPPDSAMYRTPRTLWLTRMPGKRFSRHGRDLLMEAWLQPVDSVLNSIRARVRGAHRPLTRAIGRGFAQNYVLPKIVHNELTIYLLGRNYSLRRKTKQLVVPAVNLKLARRDFRAELLRLMLMDDRDKAVALLEKHAKPAKEPPKKPPQRVPKRLLDKEDLDDAVKMIRERPKKAIKRLRKVPPAARLDYLKHAWEFRLGLTDANRISKWLRT